MIQTESIIKVIGEKMILKNITLHIVQGEATAIIGPNGAGKSTWLKIAAGLIKPTEGQVSLEGKQLKRDHYQRQQKIGYLGHQSFLYDHLTPAENLRFFANLYRVKDADKKISDLLEKVGLTFFKNEPVRSFSRGMIQRLAIARAILHEPEILLLDEPHTGLDQEASQILNEVILRSKANGVTIIMITHDFPQVVKTCERVITFKNGRVCDDVRIKGNSTSWLRERYERQAMAQ
jgi:heme exporter protein A